MIEDIQNERYWTKRYHNESTGWDIGYPSTPLKEYFDQLENKEIKILIPGAGNAYEAEYLYKNGFQNVFVLDISEAPLLNFANRVKSFPKENLIHEDFFSHESQYDLIIEQTFFCSFPPLPETRKLYAKKMAELLSSDGKLAGLWFNVPLTDEMVKRPFGGDKAEYLSYLSPYFDSLIFEKAHNSIPPRLGSELFGIFKKK